MPQLDEIDIFDRDHMTVDELDPEGNLVHRKIIFSASQEGDPLVSDARMEFGALNAPSTFNLSQKEPVRMVDPVGGSVVEVPPDLDVVQSYMDAGYRLQMPPIGAGGQLGMAKGLMSDKELEAFRMRPLPDTVINFNKGGSVEGGADQGMYRADGSVKSARGFIGPVRNLVTGGTMTEFSTDMEYDGKKIQIPTMVPTLSQEEIAYMQRMKPGTGWDMSNPLVLTIINKARAHARKRLDSGMSPFYQDEEGYLQNLQRFSLGGSVSGDIRKLQGRPEPEPLTPAQSAYFAGALADPQGAADFTGNYFEFPTSDMSIKDMLEGPRAPSFLQNISQGNYGSAALQGIGAIPFLGGISKVLRGASKAGRTPPDPRMLRASEQGFDTSTVYYHGAESDIEEFLLPSKERGQTRTADTGIFFTKSPAIASTYSLYPGVKKAEELGRAGSVYPVYLNKKDFIKITSKDFKTGELAPRMWSRLDLDEMYVTLPDGKEQSIYDYLGLDLETAPPGLLTTDKISKMVRDKTDAKGIIFENVYDTGAGLFDLRKAEFGYENYYDRKGILEPNFEPPKQRFDLSAEAEKPSEIVVAFDPSTVRSVNAQFAEKPDTELPPLSRSKGGSVDDIDIFGYSLGGSVSEMMGRTGSSLTPAQIANLAGAFADPYGAADWSGNYPEFPSGDMSVEEMLSGPRGLSLVENILQGNYGSSALQIVGALPGVGGIIKVLKAAGKIPPTQVQRLKDMGLDVDTDMYHGTTDAGPKGEGFDEFIIGGPQGYHALDGGRVRHPTSGIGVWLSDDTEMAGEFAKRSWPYPDDEFPNVLPVYTRRENPLVFTFDKSIEEAFEKAKDAANNFNPALMENADGSLTDEYKNILLEYEQADRARKYADPFVQFMRYVGIDPDKAKFGPNFDPSGVDPDLIRQRLIDEGYDSVEIRGTTWDAPEGKERSNQFLILDPRNIRSKYAKADPKDRGSAKISKAGGGAVDVRDIDIFDVDSYSLGGSVGDMIREQAGVEREDIFTPAQLANIAGGFVDPFGSADSVGLYPEFPTDRSVTIKDMARSDYPRSPSAAENLAQGDYLNLLFQGFGALPFVGGAIKTLRAMGKMPPSIVDPLSTDASGLLTGRTFKPEADLAQAKDTPAQLSRQVPVIDPVTGSQLIDESVDPKTGKIIQTPVFESVLQKQYAKDLTVPELAKLANKKSAASFLNFMDTFPAAREMATVAQAGLAKKGWYRQSAQALHDVFGDDAPRFAALLAATSPQTSVQGNLFNATSIWRNLTQNNMPRDPVLFDIINEPGVAAALKLKKSVPLKNADGSPQLDVTGKQKYGTRGISEQEAREVIKNAGGADSTFDIGRMQIEIMGDAVQGEKGAESVLDAWVANSIRAINVPADEMDKLVLSGPKVDSFMRNLVNNTVEVTNDTWMANYLGVKQDVFGGGLNPARVDPGKGPGYLAANALTRNAARILSDRLGEAVTPEMIQEMVWSWSKAVFEQSRAVGMSPREFIQKGRLTDAMINDVPDFSSLLRDPDLPYRGILKASGATIGQFKKGEIPKGNRTEEIMRSSDTARRNLERAANRLKFAKTDKLALGALAPLIAINMINMGKTPDEEEGSSEIDNIDIFN